MKLIEQIDIQLITVDNSFQREYVWLEKHQIKLIETALIGSPIPEIYLWNIGTDSDSGDTKYSIVDGQQRTGALFQYIENKFKLKESVLDSKSEIFENIKNCYFKDLEDQYKQDIWAYIFSIRIVRKSVPREKIVQMFLRLNSNNMTLNPQELRNAEFEGEFMELAAHLAEHSFWSDNNLFGIADRRRMKDVTFISNLLTFMKLGIDEEITSKNINRIYELFNEEYPNKEKDILMFTKVISLIDLIIDKSQLRQTFLASKVHLYSLFTFIYGKVIAGYELKIEEINNYRNFIDYYDKEEILMNYFEKNMPLINEYKSKSKEGTNQKSNRLRRYEILTELIN